MSELRGAVPALPRAVSTVATGITAFALSTTFKRGVIGGLLQAHKANAVMPVVAVSIAHGKQAPASRKSAIGMGVPRWAGRVTPFCFQVSKIVLTKARTSAIFMEREREGDLQLLPLE